MPRSYVQEVMADAPVGYWRLGETSGTVCADASGNNNHGTYGPVPGLNQTGVVRGDAAASFSQAGASQVGIPYSASLNCTAAWTIECWANVRNQSAPGIGGCFFSALYPGPEATVQMALGFDYLPANQGKVFTGFYSTVAGWKQAVAPTVTILNQWVHWAGVYNGSSLLLYQNSILVATLGGVGACPNATSSKWIGRRWDADEHPDASIDEVAVYNTALSPTRIRAHYAALRPYAATVLADGPIGYWRLGEQTQPAVDSSGYNRHGTYSGGITGGQVGPIYSELDAAVQLDGSTAYVSVPDDVAWNLGAFTLEAWVKTPNAGTARRRIISQQGGEGYWLMAFVGGTTLEFGSSLDTILNGFGPAINDNLWHHVVTVRDVPSGVARWYIDGVQFGTMPCVATAFGITANLEIGRYGGNTEHFAGWFDEVAIYPTALSAARVQAHYAARGTTTQRWAGASWAPLVPKRWDGSAWAPMVAKRWNGTDWV